jgi:hypothetical protein
MSGMTAAKLTWGAGRDARGDDHAGKRPAARCAFDPARCLPAMIAGHVFLAHCYRRSACRTNGTANRDRVMRRRRGVICACPERVKTGKGLAILSSRRNSAQELLPMPRRFCPQKRPRPPRDHHRRCFAKFLGYIPVFRRSIRKSENR